MGNPLVYILAPFGLAFFLFAVYLIVSLFLRDPARPFRMFKAPPLDDSPEPKVQGAEEGTVEGEWKNAGVPKKVRD
ncbi:MAG: hypothetical protein JXR72_04580 [Proteobacteria bacterium]|nr:hypothetical protein [Pseudomonadota bacterium]